METQDFVAVDFEIMTPEYTSACAIGLVKVHNGVISQKLYSLIKPIPDGRSERNTHIHGLTDEMVAEAPTFEELFPLIRSFINGYPIVCHNSSTDINVFRRCMGYYNLTGIDVDNYIDTLKLYGKGLSECCKENGILLTNHHDALADAEACAKLYLCYQGCISKDLAHYSLKNILANKEARKYEHDTLQPLADEEIENKDTIFFQKKVVITGTFDAYPNRNELGATLKSFGADVDTAISGKTNIVIIGAGAGPAKLKKIEDLNAKGKNIRLIYEEELCEIMNNLK